MHPDYIPGTPEHEAFKAEQLRLNKKASAKRARWAAHIGRPFPKSADDHEPPDPGTWDVPDAELG